MPAVDDEWRRVLMEGHPPLRVLRHVFRAVPSPPRCKVCNNPFGGVGGRVFAIAGFHPSRKNPSLCNRCCSKLEPGGIELDIAVLFADIRGSTALGEDMQASSFAELLNRFYDVATTVLIRHDAIIDKLIGDEVMALFVPGVAGPDYRRRAVQAGLDLLRGVGYGTPEGSWLELGVAVNAGVAYVGNVGPEGVTDLTAVGDAVNLAARLQAHAAGGELLVAADVDPALEGPVRDLELRGRRARVSSRVLSA